jgi:3-dehydroquinate synthase
VIRVPVQTGQGRYEVLVGDGILRQAVAELGDVCGGRAAVLVSDENVAPFYSGDVRSALRSAGCVVSEVVLPAGEAQKNLARAEELYGVLYERRLTRADTVVAVGGGVIGDLAGFVAATYLRGVRLVQVPTTLLAQVDAAVGGKVGVDFRSGKNHVGTFYQPRVVLADIETLTTLPARERRNGAVEVVKYAFLAGGYTRELVETALAGTGFAGGPQARPSDPASSASWVASGEAPDPAALCREDVVAECVRYKAEVVAADEREETGLRHVLNLGHTIGHAIEAAGGFMRYSHGEAVGLGLQATLWLSHRLTGLSESDMASGVRLLVAAGAPQRLEGLDGGAVAGLIARDKKASGAEVPFVLLSAPGSPVRGVYVPPELVREVIEWLQRL